MVVPELARPTPISKSHHHLRYLFYIAPAGLVVLAVIGYPILHAMLLSLYQYNPLNQSASLPFVGFSNYAYALARPSFRQAAAVSGEWIVGVVALQFLLGLAGAVVLNQPFRGRGLVRGLVLIPWATPSVLAALMWMWILDGNYGVLNDLLHRVGLGALAQPWLSIPQTALGSLMMIDVWQGIPFFAVMLLAAMQTIPHDMIEAARLDRASVWKIFWRIKMPLMAPTVLITTLLRIVWTASYMDLILIITQGGPGNATMTVPADAYYTAYTNFSFGQADAMAVLQAAVLFAVVLIYLRVLRRLGVFS